MSENTRSDAYPGIVCKGGGADYASDVAKKKKIDSEKIKSLRSKPIVEQKEVNSNETIELGPSSFDRNVSYDGSTMDSYSGCVILNR